MIRCANKMTLKQMEMSSLLVLTLWSNGCSVLKVHKMSQRGKTSLLMRQETSIFRGKAAQRTILIPIQIE